MVTFTNPPPATITNQLPVDKDGLTTTSGAPATGIIGAVQPAQAGVSTLTAGKLGDPAKWTTTPDQTVEGRINSLTDPNNPLVSQARSRAAQTANSRGLLNSSLAATAGESAAYDVAMPIAQADAAQASKVAGYNVDTANQFKTRDQDTATQVGLANMGASNQASQFNTGQANQFLSQSTQQGFDLAKMDKQAALTISQMTAQQQNDIAQLAAKQGFNLQTIDATQAADLAKLAVQIQAQDQQAEQKFGFDKALVEIQKASNREIAGIEAQYKNLTQASASAASIMNNLSTNVSRIMENTALDAAAKQKAIDIYNNNATKSLQLIGALSGDIDLSTYLDEVLGTTSPPPATTITPTPDPVTPTPTTPAPTPTAPAPVTPNAPYVNPYQTYPQLPSAQDRQIG